MAELAMVIGLADGCWLAYQMRKRRENAQRPCQQVQKGWANDHNHDSAARSDQSGLSSD